MYIYKIMYISDFIPWHVEMYHVRSAKKCNTETPSPLLCMYMHKILYTSDFSTLSPSSHVHVSKM